MMIFDGTVVVEAASDRLCWILNSVRVDLLPSAAHSPQTHTLFSTSLSGQLVTFKMFLNTSWFSCV